MFIDFIIDNMNEILDKLPLLYSQEDVDINIDIRYPDGTIKTITLKPIGKFYNEIYEKINGTFGYFDKRIFVDQVNGNDFNTGNGDNPLKTIKRALELIPTGGKADIVIIGDYTFRTSEIERKPFKGKHITFGSLNENDTLKVIIDNIDFNNNLSMLSVEDEASISIATNLEVSVDTTNFTDWWKDYITKDYASFIGIKNGSVSVKEHLFVIGHIPKIVCNDNTALFRCINGNVNLDLMKFANYNNSRLIQVRGSCNLSYFDPDKVGLFDTNDNFASIHWNNGILLNFIDGIVYKDGVPQNISCMQFFYNNIIVENNISDISNNTLIFKPEHQTYNLRVPQDTTINNIDCNSLFDSTNGTQMTLWGNKIATNTTISIRNLSDYIITIEHNTGSYPIITKSKQNVTLSNSDVIMLRLERVNGYYKWFEI